MINSSIYSSISDIITLSIRHNCICNSYKNLSREDWLKLQGVFFQQGLGSLFFSALENSDIRLPRDILMHCIGSIEHINKEQYYKKKYAVSLINKLEASNISTLILKGFSLSYLYPNNSIREFGDLDIYVFDKHRDTVSLIQQQGIIIEKENKHDVFNYHGLHVELHKHFLNPNRKCNRLLNQYLLEEANKSRKSKYGWYEPSPNFNAVFLLRHMISHLASGCISLRHILDYGLLLLKESENIEWEKVYDILEKTGLVYAFNTTVYLCGKILDTDFTQYQHGNTDLRIVEKIYYEIIKPPQKISNNIFARIIYKTKRLYTKKWVYDSNLLPDKFWQEVVFGSIIEHLRMPNHI